MKVYRVKRLISKRWRGMCVPPFGILIRRCCETDELIKHETQHWKQYQKYGLLLFYVRYFFQLLIFGYWDAPMEIEAREAEKK